MGDAQCFAYQTSPFNVSVAVEALNRVPKAHRHWAAACGLGGAELKARLYTEWNNFSLVAALLLSFFVGSILSPPEFPDYDPSSWQLILLTMLELVVSLLLLLTIVTSVKLMQMINLLSSDHSIVLLMQDGLYFYCGLVAMFFDRSVEASAICIGWAAYLQSGWIAGIASIFFIIIYILFTLRLVWVFHITFSKQLDREPQLLPALSTSS